MPIPGVSLVGLLPDPIALEYLEKGCCFPAATDLAAHLTEARRRLDGRAPERPGNPQLAPFPSADHEAAVRGTSRFRQAFASIALDFRMVEIAPLLACQVHVTLDAHDATLDILNLCLPTVLPSVPVDWRAQGGEDVGSVQIAVEDLNFRILRGGAAASPPGEDLLLAGVGLGIGAPFVQVLRWRDRCYLVNGFHRAVMLLRQGVSEMPCLYREIDEPDPATIIGQPGQHLVACIPPATCGDYLNGYDVPIRKTRRHVNVNWSQWVAPIE